MVRVKADLHDFPMNFEKKEFEKELSQQLTKDFQVK